MEIPGYKWDPVRNRYFKVLKTGELPNSQYTVSALAAADRRKERDRKREFQLEAGTIQPKESRLRPQTVLKDRSEERVTAFALIKQHEANERSGTVTHSMYTPIVAYRNGVIAGPASYSPEGRTVVAMEYSDGIFAAAVDNDFGSVVVGPRTTVQLPHEFVTGLAVAPVLLIASDRGLRFNSSCLDVGSLSSVAARPDGQALCGAKDGRVKLVDVSTQQVTEVFEFANQRAVTNVAFADRNLAVSTGLEDEMYLFDLRADHAVARQFEYSNWSAINNGLGVYKGRIAASQEGGIKIYDLRGDVLVTVPTEETPAPCLRYVEEGVYFGTRNRLKLAAKRRFQADATPRDVGDLYAKLNEGVEPRAQSPL